MESKVKRRIWSALALLGSGLLALGVFAAMSVNWSDAAPSPSARQLPTWQAPDAAALQMASERNGHFILAGLDAPLGESPITDAARLGRARLEREMQRYQAWQESPDPENTALPQPLVPSPALSLSSPFPEGLEFWRSWERGCRVHVLSQRDAFEALVQQHQALLDRHAAAGAAATYVNHFPAFYGEQGQATLALREVQQLLLVRAMLRLQADQEEAAVADLENGLRLQQRMAQQPQSLVMALVAISNAKMEMICLADLLRQDPILRRPAHLKRLAKTVDEMDLSMLPALRADSAPAVDYVHILAQQTDASGAAARQSPGWRGWLARRWQQHVFQPQRTLNTIAARQDEVAELATTPIHEFAAAANARADLAQSEQATKAGAWQSNTVGNALVSIGTSRTRWLDFISHAHEVEGWRRLLLLQLAIYRDGLNPAEVPAWLAQSPKVWHNPYTLAPVAWDVDTASLVLERPAGRDGKATDPLQIQLFPLQPE